MPAGRNEASAVLDSIASASNVPNREDIPRPSELDWSDVSEGSQPLQSTRLIHRALDRNGVLLLNHSEELAAVHEPSLRFSPLSSPNPLSADVSNGDSAQHQITQDNTGHSASGTESDDFDFWKIRLLAEGSYWSVRGLNACRHPLQVRQQDINVSREERTLQEHAANQTTEFLKHGINGVTPVSVPDGMQVSEFDITRKVRASTAETQVWDGKNPTQHIIHVRYLADACPGMMPVADSAKFSNWGRSASSLWLQTDRFKQVALTAGLKPAEQNFAQAITLNSDGVLPMTWGHGAASDLWHLLAGSLVVYAVPYKGLRKLASVLNLLPPSQHSDAALSQCTSDTAACAHTSPSTQTAEQESTVKQLSGLFHALELGSLLPDPRVLRAAGVPLCRFQWRAGTSALVAPGAVFWGVAKERSIAIKRPLFYPCEPWLGVCKSLATIPSPCLPPIVHTLSRFATESPGLISPLEHAPTSVLSENSGPDLLPTSQIDMLTSIPNVAENSHDTSGMQKGIDKQSVRLEQGTFEEWVPGAVPSLGAGGVIIARPHLRIADPLPTPALQDESGLNRMSSNSSSTLSVDKATYVQERSRNAQSAMAVSSPGSSVPLQVAPKGQIHSVEESSRTNENRYFNFAKSTPNCTLLPDGSIEISQGSSVSALIESDPVLRDASWIKGSKSVRYDFVVLKREQNAAVGITEYQRGGKVCWLSRPDDLIVLTDAGQTRLHALNQGRRNGISDTTVYSLVLHCDGGGNCRRSCGGYGMCESSCTRSQRKTDHRHNCSLQIRLHATLRQAANGKLSVTVSGCHIPQDSDVEWEPAPSRRRKLPLSQRDAIARGRAMGISVSMIQMQQNVGESSAQSMIPASTEVPRSKISVPKGTVDLMRMQKVAEAEDLAAKRSGADWNNVCSIMQEVVQKPPEANVHWNMHNASVISAELDPKAGRCILFHSEKCQEWLEFGSAGIRIGMIVAIPQSLGCGVRRLGCFAFVAEDKYGSLLPFAACMFDKVGSSKAHLTAVKALVCGPLKEYCKDRNASTIIIQRRAFCDDGSAFSEFEKAAWPMTIRLSQQGAIEDIVDFLQDPNRKIPVPGNHGLAAVLAGFCRILRSANLADLRTNIGKFRAWLHELEESESLKWVCGLWQWIEPRFLTSPWVESLVDATLLEPVAQVGMHSSKTVNVIADSEIYVPPGLDSHLCRSSDRDSLQDRSTRRADWLLRSVTGRTEGEGWFLPALDDAKRRRSKMNRSMRSKKGSGLRIISRDVRQREANAAWIAIRDRVVWQRGSQYAWVWSPAGTSRDWNDISIRPGKSISCTFFEMCFAAGVPQAELQLLNCSLAHEFILQDNSHPFLSLILGGMGNTVDPPPESISADWSNGSYCVNVDLVTGQCCCWHFLLRGRVRGPCKHVLAARIALKWMEANDRNMVQALKHKVQSASKAVERRLIMPRPWPPHERGGVIAGLVECSGEGLSDVETCAKEYLGGSKSQRPRFAKGTDFCLEVEGDNFIVSETDMRGAGHHATAGPQQPSEHAHSALSAADVNISMPESIKLGAGASKRKSSKFLRGGAY